MHPLGAARSEHLTVGPACCVRGQEDRPHHSHVHTRGRALEEGQHLAPRTNPGAVMALPFGGYLVQRCLSSLASFFTAKMPMGLSRGARGSHPYTQLLEIVHADLVPSVQSLLPASSHCSSKSS